MRVSVLSLWLVLIASQAGGQEEDQTARAREAGFLLEGDLVVAVEGPNDGALELLHCIELALDANEDLEQAREGLGDVKGQKTLALATGMPRIELQGAFNRGRDPSFAFDESFAGGEGDPFQSVYDYVDPLFQNAGIVPPVVAPAAGGFFPAPEDIQAQTFWRTYLDGYWELHPTQLLRALRAADDAIYQQHAMISDTSNRTIEAVIRNFHGVVLAQERVSAMERELEARQEFMEVTRRRYQLEFATPLDTLQAAVSLANLQPEYRRRKIELRQRGQELNQLIGRDPMSPIEVVATFPLEEDNVDEQLVLSLAARRPDLEAQRAESEIAEAKRGVATARRHPYLSADARWGFVTRDLSDLTDSGHDFWNVGLTLHIPIFDGLNAKGEIQRAEADLLRNESAVRQLERQVRNEVVLALENLEIARVDLEAAKLNMLQAADAYTMVSLRYELGKADRLEVLNAQSARFVARTTLIEARFEVLASTATLKRSIGISPAQALRTIPEIAQNEAHGDPR